MCYLHVRTAYCRPQPLHNCPIFEQPRARRKRQRTTNRKSRSGLTNVSLVKCSQVPTGIPCISASFYIHTPFEARVGDNQSALLETIDVPRPTQDTLYHQSTVSFDDQRSSDITSPCILCLETHMLYSSFGYACLSCLGFSICQSEH